jgi:hypothetical protein
MLSVLPLIRVCVRVLHVCIVTVEQFGCHTHETSLVSSNNDDNDDYKIMMMMIYFIKIM